MKGLRLVSPVVHEDGICRCTWCGTDPVYVAYHDTEWGVPEYDSRALFEKLQLDGFQAGLSWITILRKREAFRKAFDDFNPEKMARYRPAKLERLMNDAGIVRNRLKIEASVSNAQAYLAIPDFSAYLWNFMDGKPLQNRLRSLKDVPAMTPLAEEISKDMKKRGFRFVGPTIVYAFMQACGLVNDHMIDCHRHEAVKKLAR
ncbi:MAG: DNA-3-methyladenine glycosylase I [Hyphomicrobiales bacterium]|nr:DNA-3-methyladenine glycosylase I [Hyphomicrobiales bacterium]MBP9175176.1 DNA-3-methyladenine glycosylase I [Hyphomicrobiales bacterium]MCC7482857.1 DNA-3-methyladenine glycosylase I [Hyphomicrobiales bacterium]